MTPESQPADSTNSVNRSDSGSSSPATVMVRGEAVREEKAPAKPQSSHAKGEVSPAKAKLQQRLPELEDDGDVGTEKEQRVGRDNKADLTFTGTLLASAAPEYADEDYWWEYRVYATNGGKHVFSKVSRSLYVNKADHQDAEVFDPDPSSVPSQLLKSARDLTRSHPMGWKDAAVKFFGYNSLAKKLYRKLGDGFDERVD